MYSLKCFFASSTDRGYLISFSAYSTDDPRLWALLNVITDFGDLEVRFPLNDDAGP